MTTAISHRDRLKSIRERTHAARGDRARAQKLLDAAVAAGDGQGEEIAKARLGEVAIELATAEQLETMVLSSMAGVANSNGRGLGGESFLDDPNTVATLEQLAHSSQPVGSVMLGPLLSAERFAATLSPRAQSDDQPGLQMYRNERYPVVRQTYRPLSLLDLIPTSTMSGAMIEYVVEYGNLDTGVAETAEGEIKPEGELGFEEATAPARTIATWIKQRRQVMADIPELASVLNQRLTYQVQRRIEQQILIGDGVGQNLLGMLNQTGILSVGPDPAFIDADMVLRGITQVSLAGGVANGVVMNPLDYEGMLLEKAAATGERLDTAGAFETPANTIWGQPVILSQVIPQNTALVGDFQKAATLLIREGVNVRVSDSDSDDFVRNRVTVLAEARVALPIWAPSALCEVILSP